MADNEYTIHANLSELKTAFGDLIRQEKQIAAAAAARGRAQEDSFSKASRSLKAQQKELRDLLFQEERGVRLTDDKRRRIEQLTRSTRDLKGQMDRAGEASRNMTGNANTGLANAASSATRFAGQLVGIGSAIGGVYAIARLLKNEYEHLKKQQELAATAQLTTGQVAARALQNLPKGMSVQDATAAVKAASDTSKLPEKDVWGIADTMLSAKGGLSTDQFSKAIGQVARVQAVSGDAEGAQVLGQGMLNLMNLGAPSPEAAGGFIYGVGAASNVTNRGKQVRAIVPVVSNAGEYGFTPEQAGELFSYATHRGGDMTGEQSSTGTIAFMKWIEDQRAAGVIKARGMQGLMELQTRVGAMREHEQAKFLSSMTGEAKVKGAWMALLRKAPESMTAYDATQQQIGGLESTSNTGIFNEYFRNVAQLPYENLRETERTFDWGADQLDLLSKGAAGGLVRKKLGEYMDRIPGLGDTERKLVMAKWEARSDFGKTEPISSAITALEEQKKNLPVPWQTGSWEQGHGLWFESGSYGKAHAYHGELPDDVEFNTSGSMAHSENGWAPDRYFVRNPDYNPSTEPAMDQVIEQLRGIQDEMKRAADKMAPAANQQTPNPSAHLEGAP